MAKIAHWLFDQKHKGERFLFSLFLLFLPTQLGKHFWPQFSYLLGIRSDYISPTLYFTDILVIVLFIVYIRDQGAKKILRFEQNDKKNLYMAICIFVYLLITILFSNNILLGFYGLWKFAECIFIGVYIAKRADKIIPFSQIIFLLSIGGIFESLLAIAQFVNQGSLNGIFYFFGERSFTSQTIGIADMSLNGTELVRPYATFSHPNVLAGYLLLISTLLLFAIWKKYKPFLFSPVYYLFSFFLCSFALLLTYGRVAILCWVITLAAFIFIQLRKKPKHISILLGVLFFVLLFLAGLHFQLFQRFSALTLSDESVTQREVLLSASWQLFANHVFFGVGLNNFLPSLSRLPIMQLNFFLLQPVHNIFALIGVETGVIGLGVFITLFVKTVINLYKQTIKKGNGYAFFCSLLVLQIIFTGMFDHYWLTLQQGQLLTAFIIGLCWSNYINE